MEMNQALRQSLFERGQDDGYLLYTNGEPAGWAQVGPRDRLEKLVREYGCDPDPGAWAVTCFLLAPQLRRQGLARRLLGAILSDLPERGARSVEAYARRGVGLDAEDVWTGPEALFLEAGFLLIQDHPRRPRYRKELAGGASMTGRV
jgi:GNAT superfamily N-acetyltransferase